MKAATLSLLAATAAGAMVELSLQHVAAGTAVHAGLLARRAARAGPYPEALAYSARWTAGGFFANVTVGTPPQPQLLLVDTVLERTWVVARDAVVCWDGGAACAQHPATTFDRDKSTTYRLGDENDLSVWFGQWAVEGDTFSDTFTIGGATVPRLRDIGYARSTARGAGLLGLGYPPTASSAHRPMLLDQLQRQGRIGTRVYGLYLGGSGDGGDGSDGALVLGGLDTGKFVGTLVVLPTTPSTVAYDNETATDPYLVPAVDLASLALLVDGVADPAVAALPNRRAGSVPAWLAAGEPLSYVPRDMAAAIFAAVGAYVSPQTQLAYVDCTTTNTIALRLVFGAPDPADPAAATVAVTVPAAHLVLAIPDQDDALPDAVPPSPFARTCLFGLQNLDSRNPFSGPEPPRADNATTANYLVLGAHVLRALYTVVDLDHHQIALAPARPNASHATLYPLPAGLPGLPATTLPAGATPPSSKTTTQPTTTATATATTTATATETLTPAIMSAAAAVRAPGLLAALACLLFLVG